MVHATLLRAESAAGSSREELGQPATWTDRRWRPGGAARRVLPEAAYETSLLPISIQRACQGVRCGSGACGWHGASAGMGASGDREMGPRSGKVGARCDRHSAADRAQEFVAKGAAGEAIHGTEGAHWHWKARRGPGAGRPSCAIQARRFSEDAPERLAAFGRRCAPGAGTSTAKPDAALEGGRLPDRRQPRVKPTGAGIPAKGAAQGPGEGQRWKSSIFWTGSCGADACASILEAKGPRGFRCAGACPREVREVHAIQGCAPH
mmetsp:Transcript_78400/g.187963  ORF Transcript_78400/g.187963 Transcript_78400/m.187963 type:complete len:264 (+) Transcript_78400:638-1429(+)